MVGLSERGMILCWKEQSSSFENGLSHFVSGTIKLVFEMHSHAFLQGGFFVCNIVRRGMCFCFLLPACVPVQVFSLLVLCIFAVVD